MTPSVHSFEKLLHNHLSNNVMLSAYFNNNKQQICINLTIRNIVWFKLSLSISQLTCFNSLVYSAEEKLTTFLD